MIEQPTENIKFTTEQLLQLDKFEKRLENLKVGIDIHSRNIEGLKNTNALLEKDRENLTRGIEEKKSVKEQLEKDIVALKEPYEKARKLLQDTLNEQNIVSQQITQQQADLNDKKTKLEASIKSHQEEKDAFQISLQNHKNEKQELINKKNILQNTISEIQEILKEI
jgi:chromosome segregation ATPase